jgi:hypothetical protein
MKFGWRDEMKMKSLLLVHAGWHSGPNKKDVDSLPTYTVIGGR